MPLMHMQEALIREIFNLIWWEPLVFAVLTGWIIASSWADDG